MTNEQTSEQGQETTYGQYAGFVTRLVALIIDQLILTGIVSLITIVATYVMNIFRVNELLGTENLTQTITVILVTIVTVSVVILYTIGFWLLAGQTPGKRLMGVRIVRTNGQRITLWAAVRRWVGYWLSAILFLGYLWVLLDNKRQGFHDKLAGTVVVYSWPEREQKGTFVRDHISHLRRSREMARKAETN